MKDGRIWKRHVDQLKTRSTDSECLECESLDDVGPFVGETLIPHTSAGLTTTIRPNLIPRRSSRISKPPDRFAPVVSSYGGRNVMTIALMFLFIQLINSVCKLYGFCCHYMRWFFCC